MSNVVPPHEPAPRERQFSKPLLGAAAALMSLALIAVIVYAMSMIVPLLTQTPGVVSQRVAAEKELNVAYIATLEYESFAIRTQGIQIALGFLVGLILATFGMILFAIGATDAFEASGVREKAQVTLKSTAPGLIVLIVSGAIICFAVTKNVQRTFEASYDQGKAPHIKSSTMDPPNSGKGTDKPQKD